MCFRMFQEFPGSGNLVLLEQHEQNHTAGLEKDFPFGGKRYHRGHISLSLVAKGTLMMSHLLHFCNMLGITQDTERNTVWSGEQLNCS